MITLPRAGRGRRSAVQEAAYQTELAAFVVEIKEIDSRSDFRVSSRGWCYLLEEHGLNKGEFDLAEDLINKCRRTGLLPMDICAEDGARGYDHIEYLDDDDPAVFLKQLALNTRENLENYTPVSFWDDKPVYIQCWTEKIDLKSLFSQVCEEFRIPLANCRGWYDMNMRAALMRRFKAHEEAGRQCVLLYAGDFDPAGFVISDYIRSNLEELSGAVGWHPDKLEIYRFGLNLDFIQQHKLTWIENLITGSGSDLASPKHRDYRKRYVQSYLKTYGVRKVEANALVTRPEAGRELCRQAILKYLNNDAADDYQERLDSYRGDLFDKHFDYLEVKYDPCCKDCYHGTLHSDTAVWCFCSDDHVVDVEIDGYCDEFRLRTSIKRNGQ